MTKLTTLPAMRLDASIRRDLTRKLRVWLVSLTVALGLGASAYWATHRVPKTVYPPVAADALVAAAPLKNGLPLGELDSQVAAGNLDGAHVHVSLFASGLRAGSGWGASGTVEGALALAYQAARADQEKAATTAVIAIAHGREQVTTESRRRLLASAHSGVYGLSIESTKKGDRTPRVSLYSPVEMVVTNRTLSEQLEVLAKEPRARGDGTLESDRVGVLHARQFYVDLEHGKPGIELLRGNTLIRPAEVTQQSLRAFARRMSEWMLNNVQEDGRMVYMYWPSRGAESRDDDNTVRQFMATICLERIAKEGELPRARETADRNLRYTLKRFYKDREGLGSIEYGKSSKLGAIALALIAILESPLRPELRSEEQALRRALDHLWRQSGELRSFLFPPEHNDNQNFYPGEALLAWALSLKENADPELGKKFLASFAYYKKWHLANRNPAFVPWHTQAYFVYWHLHEDSELSGWIFTMNDWLLDLQKRSMVAYPDTLGRFYDPQNPEYGPPHASATGAYLEGLIDAFTLARELGDGPRLESYRRSILLGLRDAMQLEFADDVDMFYIAKRERVQGGLRTTVYDNGIRVDNVQHVLMALQKVLRVFGPGDYRPIEID